MESTEITVVYCTVLAVSAEPSPPRSPLPTRMERMLRRAELPRFLRLYAVDSPLAGALSCAWVSNKFKFN